MRRIIKKVTAVLLTLTILSTSAVSAFAESNTNDNVKTDLNYEKGSIEELLETNDTMNRIGAKSVNTKELIYTYKENGIKYKVYGQANNDLTNTNSSIYKINSDGEEILYLKEKINVKDNIITTTITQNGKDTVSVIDLNDEDDRNITTNSLNNFIQAYGTWSGYPVSDTYEPWGTFRCSKAIKTYTTVGVTATINAIVKYSKRMDTKSKMVVTSIATIVGFIVRYSLPKVYYNEDISYRYTEIPNAYVQQKAVERTVRTFYTDSNRATVEQIVTTTIFAEDYKN